MKAQPIRLLDVFVIGPLMIYAGTQSKPPWLQTALVAIGIGTMFYNGRNYLLIEQQKENEPLPVGRTIIHD